MMIQLESNVIPIPSTRGIRKKSPIHCGQGQQAAHEVGLNLVKRLFNYYAKERDIVISDDELALLIVDINERDNLECESVEANIDDKYVEKEVLSMLFDGDETLSELSEKAQLMFRRLLALLHRMQQAMPSERLNVIIRELEGHHIPLPRHCYQCKGLSFFYEQSDGVAMIDSRTFCCVNCQYAYEVFIQ